MVAWRLITCSPLLPSIRWRVQTVFTAGHSDTLLLSTTNTTTTPLIPLHQSAISNSNTKSSIINHHTTTNRLPIFISLQLETPIKHSLTLLTGLSSVRPVLESGGTFFPPLLFCCTVLCSPFITNYLIKVT